MWKCLSFNYRINHLVFFSDIDPPDIICLPVVTHIISSGQTSGVVTWAVPEVYDNSGNVTVYNITGPSSGSDLDLGQHTVVYQATDETGNLSPVCTMVINVQGIVNAY